MTTHPDYYAILGVNKKDATADIRKAYKKLARKYHPDANPGDDSALEQFKEIQTAWAVLGDEEKRGNFDRFGTPDAAPFQGSGPQPAGRRWSYSSDGGEVPFDLEDILGGFAGGRQGAGRADWPIRGHDIRTEVRIPFMMAAEGGKYDLRLQREGSSSPETLAVAIPAGIDTGTVVRLSGEGTPGFNGGAAGDLLVSIKVTPHQWFRREGARVFLEVPISLTEAALGTKVDIPTILDGIVTLTIPPGTSSGSKLRLRGKGIRDRRSGIRGDMLAVIRIVAPKKIDDRTRELLESLRAAETDDCRAGLWQ